MLKFKRNSFYDRNDLIIIMIYALSLYRRPNNTLRETDSDSSNQRQSKRDVFDGRSFNFVLFVSYALIVRWKKNR